MKKILLALSCLIVFISLSGQVIHHFKILDAIDRVSMQDEIPERLPFFTVDDLFRMKTVAEAEISPDRRFAAFTVNVPRPFHH